MVLGAQGSGRANERLCARVCGSGKSGADCRGGVVPGSGFKQGSRVVVGSREAFALGIGGGCVVKGREWMGSTKDKNVGGRS